MSLAWRAVDHGSVHLYYKAGRGSGAEWALRMQCPSIGMAEGYWTAAKTCLRSPPSSVRASRWAEGRTSGLVARPVQEVEPYAVSGSACAGAGHRTFKLTPSPVLFELDRILRCSTCRIEGLLPAADWGLAVAARSRAKSLQNCHLGVCIARIYHH